MSWLLPLLVLRLLLPVGTMPVHTSAGAALALCSGTAPTSTAATPQSRGGVGSGAHRALPSCAFVSLAGITPPFVGPIAAGRETISIASDAWEAARSNGPANWYRARDPPGA